MDFEKLLKDSWELMLKEIVPLILFGLLGAVLCMTVILIPTVVAGFARGFLGFLRTGKAPEFSELWNFEDFVQVLLLCVVAGTLISIGYMLLVVPGVFLNVWWLYALFFLVDKKMGFWAAMTASKDGVGKAGFVQHLIVFLILGVLNSIGSSLAGLGALVTMPFSMILLGLCYQEMIGERK